MAQTFPRNPNRPRARGVDPQYSRGLLGYLDASEGAGDALDRAALASTTVPGVGDVLGLLADSRQFYREPTLGNALGGLLGAMPFIPAASVTRTLGIPRSFDIPRNAVLNAGKLTPAEKKYFSEIFSSEPDLQEFLDAVPGAKLKGDDLFIPESSVDGLMKYIDDTVSLEAGQSRLPPSFVRGDDFVKRFVPPPRI